MKQNTGKASPSVAAEKTFCVATDHAVAGNAHPVELTTYGT